MTHLRFYKYQATGNDFILIDNLNGELEHSEELAQQLCDRKFGIGSDGLILLQNTPDHDFEMVFYNPDGSKSLCGNGSRCAVNFARKLGIIENTCDFLAYDGRHDATILANDVVRLKMNDVQPVRSLEDGTFVDTGSPHLMVFTDNIENLDVVNSGRSIRYNSHFKENGININFVKPLSDNSIFVRTYERGVENETLSCGTGVTASAIASKAEGLSSPVSIKTKGGNLEVEFEELADGSFKNVYLIGPAREVFSGTIALN